MSARVTRTRHDRSGTAAITAWRSAWAFSQALIVDRRASRSLTDVPIANVLGITRTAARDRPAHDRLPRHTEALNHAIEVDNPIAHARDAFAVFHAERVNFGIFQMNARVWHRIVGRVTTAIRTR